MVEDQLRVLAPTKTDEAEYDEIDDDNDDKYQQKTFVMDASLFNASDGTEEYQRKQFAQDMKKLWQTQKGPMYRKCPIISEYDYSEELDLTKQNDSDSNDNDNKEESNANDGVVVDNLKLIDVDYTAITPKLLDENRKPTTSITTSTQTQTDWSLLSKFDLASDQPHHTIGVRKNFGACFAGRDSYFHYNDAETISQIISYTIDLNLRIKSRSDNGVILWTGKVESTDRDKDDYLSLGIENGYLHFRYNLGSGEIYIRFNATKTVAKATPGKLRQLNTDTGLYVGGMPDVQYFTRQRYVSGIVGCISEIVLAGELKMNFDPNTLGTAHNVETGLL
uniref:Laminin G domain-containing protein n=1 Tax=Glossina palpalis gambiensis TaxID=67801 RepID=A0A1B0C296_9MUSC